MCYLILNDIILHSVKNFIQKYCFINVYLPPSLCQPHNWPKRVKTYNRSQRIKVKSLHQSCLQRTECMQDVTKVKLRKTRSLFCKLISIIIWSLYILYVIIYMLLLQRKCIIKPSNMVSLLSTGTIIHSVGEFERLIN